MRPRTRPGRRHAESARVRSRHRSRRVSAGAPGDARSSSGPADAAVPATTRRVGRAVVGPMLGRVGGRRRFRDPCRGSIGLMVPARGGGSPERATEDVHPDRAVDEIADDLQRPAPMGVVGRARRARATHEQHADHSHDRGERDDERLQRHAVPRVVPRRSRLDRCRPRSTGAMLHRSTPHPTAPCGSRAPHSPPDRTSAPPTPHRVIGRGGYGGVSWSVRMPRLRVPRVGGMRPGSARTGRVPTARTRRGTRTAGSPRTAAAR